MIYYSKTERTNLLRNVIINGNFNIWQAGTSFPGLTGNTGYSPTADMWNFGETLSSGAVGVYAETTLKPNQNCLNTYKVKVDTAQSGSVPSGEYIHFFHGVEGYDFLKIKDLPAVLSFWAYASETGTYCIFFRDAGATVSYIIDFTINQVNTWEYKRLNIDFANSGGTWNVTNVGALSVGFCLCTGSTYQTSTPGQWVTGNKIGSTNISNNFQKTANNIFLLSHVQLESGYVATQYEYIPFDLEYVRCRRHYQKFSIMSNHSDQLQNGTGVMYSSILINKLRATPNWYSILNPLMWSRQNGWRTPTSTTSTTVSTDRVTFIFHDTGVSNYTALDSGLIKCDVIISASLWA